VTDKENWWPLEYLDSVRLELRHQTEQRRPCSANRQPGDADPRKGREALATRWHELFQPRIDTAV